jgi:hypothetical protein
MHSNPASYLWRSTCSLQSKYPHKIPYDIASLKHFVGTCLWPCPAIGWLFDLLYSTCTQRCQTNFKIVATISTCGSNRGKDEYHALFHVHKRDILPSCYVSNDGALGKLLHTLPSSNDHMNNLISDGANHFHKREVQGKFHG